MPDLSKRSKETEIMDNFLLDHDQIDGALDELEVINTWLGGFQVIINGLEKLKLTGNVHIADWGCGGGDMLRLLSKWAKKKNIAVKLTGIDATHSAVEYASAKSKEYPEIDIILANVIEEMEKVPKSDVVISTLFTHHFDDESWVELITNMYFSARKAVIINDIHRHWLAYHSINLLTGLFSKSKMVKNDAGLSVLRSFKKSELKALLSLAGIRNYKIRWMWAFRWQIIIYK
ncbi:MAG: Methyltransferase type 12 [Sphingobacteriales bacterium]|nr:Methyltransferase type 12 [Sphingobacteriales bacterium]